MKVKRYLEQLELQNKMLSFGINIVCCRVCGFEFFHEIDKEKLTCPECEFTSNSGDFPNKFVYTILETET